MFFKIHLRVKNRRESIPTKHSLIRKSHSRLELMSNMSTITIKFPGNKHGGYFMAVFII